MSTPHAHRRVCMCDVKVCIFVERFHARYVRKGKLPGKSFNFFIFLLNEQLDDNVNIDLNIDFKRRLVWKLWKFDGESSYGLLRDNYLV